MSSGSLDDNVKGTRSRAESIASTASSNQLSGPNKLRKKRPTKPSIPPSFLVPTSKSPDQRSVLSHIILDADREVDDEEFVNRGWLGQIHARFQFP